MIFRSLTILCLGSPVNDFRVDKAGYKDRPVRSFLHSLPSFRNSAVQRHAVAEFSPLLEKAVKLPDLDDALAPSTVMQATSRLKIKRRIQLSQDRGDIIGHLINAKGGGVNEDARVAETELVARYLILHGYETSTCILQGALLLLLQKPAKMCKMTDEVRQQFTKDEEGQLQGPMQDLPYLNAVLQETMRLPPPVADRLRRKVVADVSICGRPVPKNVSSA